MTFKKAKVVMLPTNEKAIRPLLYNPSTDKLEITKHTKDYSANEYHKVGYKTFHLYFTSDDEIEVGDWCMSINKNSKLHKPFQCTKNEAFTNAEFLNSNDCKDIKKIIATTDSSLSCTCTCGCIKKVNTGLCSGCGRFTNIPLLPQPSISFIQKYIQEYNKGVIITDVMVEYVDNGYEDWIGDDRNGEPFWNEKIELKINLKDNTITIKKVKDSWNREEVIELLKQFNDDKPGIFDCTNWIENNL